MSDAPTDEEEKNNKGKDDWKWIDENVKAQPPERGECSKGCER